MMVMVMMMMLDEVGIEISEGTNDAPFSPCIYTPRSIDGLLWGVGWWWMKEGVGCSNRDKVGTRGSQGNRSGFLVQRCKPCRTRFEKLFTFP